MTLNEPRTSSLAPCENGIRAIAIQGHSVAIFPEVLQKLSARLQGCFLLTSRSVNLYGSVPRETNQAQRLNDRSEIDDPPIAEKGNRPSVLGVTLNIVMAFVKFSGRPTEAALITVETFSKLWRIVWGTPWPFRILRMIVR